MVEYYKNLSLENLPYINEEGLSCLEKWRDIPGYEGYYQASNLGRIKSLGMKVTNSLGNSDTKKERILRQFNNGKGYLSVQLYSSNKNKRLYVHRLVMLSFFGESIGDLIVDHVNTIRSDNRLSNLRYVTCRFNVSRKRENGLFISPFTGVSRGRNKFKKWRATIKIYNQTYFIGSFYTEQEASNSYQNAVYNWETHGITPKGETLAPSPNTIFTNKSKNIKGKRAKIVLCLATGIFYDCLKDACKALNIPYKHTSAMLTGKRTNFTSLIYV